MNPLASNLRRISAAIFLSLLLWHSAAAQAMRPADQYCNPLDVLCADPFILHEKGVYYLYATSSLEGLLVWTSSDLVNWQVHGFAYKRSGQTWANRDFWAPELFTNNGKYYLHFTAVGGENDSRRVVLAESDSPLGPFKELKAPWFNPGKQTIDSHVFRDTDRALYLYSVQLGQPFEIRVRKIDPQRLTPSEDSTLCIKGSEKWEGGVVNEGPFVVKHGETYFLTYSANGFADPNYCVGVATAKSPLGPWTKRAAGPILIRKPGSHVSGAGHHCFIDSPDGKEWFIAYHTHQQPAHPSGERQLCIDRARFVPGDDGGETIHVEGPTETAQPMPSGAPPLVRGQSDEFKSPQLDRRRWTIFNEVGDHASLQNRRLVIRTQDGDIFQERSDLKNLFLQYAPLGDFAVTTRVTIKPARDYEQAFLYLWQDHNNFAKLAIVHSKKPCVEVAVEADGQYKSELHDLPFAIDQGISLRLRKRGEQYECQISADDKDWQTIASRPMKLIDLRVGIGACSPASGREIPASFEFVRFSNP